MVSTVKPADAQTKAAAWEEVQRILKNEGEVFISVDYWNQRLGKYCTTENLFNNELFAGKDLVKVLYLNATEMFCEPYVLQSRYIYEFNPADLDAGASILVQKKFDYGNGKLTEGNPYWFEVQVRTQQNKPLIKQKDLESQETNYLSSVGLIFKTQEGAKSAYKLLKESVVR